MALPEQSRRFWRISTAGVFFQGGAAAVDSSTIIATLVHGLTGSPFAVGAATAILRCGWLSPQIFVAYLAQRRRRRMPFYMVGAFGRVVCLAGVAAALAAANVLPTKVVVVLLGAQTAGALVNGTTIAMLGYLMEISPDDRRPAYSGYFNALVAPAALLPLVGAVVVTATSLRGVFAVSLVAAVLQYWMVRRLRHLTT
jgi:hypothetical protein